MNISALTEDIKKIDEILAANKDLLDQNLYLLKKKEGIDSPSNLEQAFKSLQEKDRCLNIGVLGRVKAGKSSLLNALFFDGQNILPKAATPMTAALTTLSWSNTFSVDVEFFSKKDIDLIADKANRYDELLMKQIHKEEKLRKSKKKNNSVQKKSPQRGNDDSILKNKSKQIKKKSQRILKQSHPELSAAYEHNQLLKKIAAPLIDGRSVEKLKASSPQELAQALQSYVGANGKYMPLAKAVHLYMPVEELRDIRIIDTPGMNDPVQSREARTIELLKECDVVLVVSPAGQFLTSQDQELMERITTKEGVQRIILVASKVDTELFGSEKATQLSQTLNNITTQIASHALSALTTSRALSPGLKKIYDQLIKSTGKGILHNSGVCHSIVKRIENKQNYDELEQTVFKNLCDGYPDYFPDSTSQVTTANLEKIANIPGIFEELNQVREQKDDLKAQKIATLWEQKKKALLSFRTSLKEHIDNQIHLIQDSDIANLEAQHKELESQSVELSRTIDQVYRQDKHEFISTTNSCLTDEYNKIFSDSEKKIDRAEDIYTAHHSREKSGFFSGAARVLGLGGYESYSTTEIKIKTTKVHSALNDILADFKEHLEDNLEASKLNFDKMLAKDITPVIKKSFENGSEINPYMLATSLENVISSLPTPSFSLDTCIPEEVKSCGTVKGTDAKRYRDHVDKFIVSLREESRKKISNYRSELKNTLPEKFSDTLTAHLNKNIQDLISRVKNKQQSIDRLTRASKLLFPENEVKQSDLS